MNTSNGGWVKRFKYTIWSEPVQPGVFRVQSGGLMIRGRTRDPLTGRTRHITNVVHDVSPKQAYRILQERLDMIRNGAGEGPTRISFGDYAVSLFEARVADGTIRSEKTKENWSNTLELHLLPYWQKVPMHVIRRKTVIAWRNEKLAPLVKGETYSPVTVNDWLKIFRAIVRAYVAEQELEYDPVAHVEDFDLSTHHTYTEEEPNSLTPGEVPEFLSAMRETEPQHYAMTFLGFGTGWRPSTLRPLRWQGPNADVLWGKNEILVRRSQTIGEAIERTKTGIRQRVLMPKEVMDVLDWHVQFQMPDGVPSDCELLFPSETGGYRSRSCLDKPFARVAKAIGLKKRITPKGMRRTFQDLARAAQVKDIVTRAVSGHATENMQHHYSTVSANEVCEGIAKVISLASARRAT